MLVATFLIMAQLWKLLQGSEDIGGEERRLETLRKERSEVQTQVGHCRESKDKLQRQIK